MLLAPFALTDAPRAAPAPVRRRRASAPTLRSTPVPPWLVAWAVLGVLAVLFIPGARGGGLGGATVPFWLAVAPWLDIAWLTRRRWFAVVTRRPH